MNYNQITLIGLGLFGVLMHCLVELHKINKRTNGKAKLKEYINLEIYSILISTCMAIASSFIGAEIKTALDKIGWGWLFGASFIAIGYMGQSLLVFVMGRASGKIGMNDSGPVSSDTDKKD